LASKSAPIDAPDNKTGSFISYLLLTAVRDIGRTSLLYSHRDFAVQMRLLSKAHFVPYSHVCDL
jgi:hypothetical protein